MLENLNYSLFNFINATPDSAPWMITLAIIIAKDLILVVPFLAVILWLWGPRGQLSAQRQLVIKIALAIVISLIVSWVIGHLFPMIDRLLIILAITSCIMLRMTHSPVIMAQ